MKKRLLIVEDALDFQVLLARIFPSPGYLVTLVSSSSKAREALELQEFDLVLLDISLPDGDGLELFQHLQGNEHTQSVPVIFLTGSSDLNRKVEAFSLGAEDYITKPFDHVELKARVDAKLKKFEKHIANQNELRVGPFRLSLSDYRVTAFDGTQESQFELTPREFRILHFLSQHKNSVLTRGEILDHVWGKGTNVVERSVDTHVYLLRKKLGAFGGYILSVSGSGYKLAVDDGVTGQQNKVG